MTPADVEVDKLLEWLDSRGVKQVMAEGLHESLTHVVDGTAEIGNAIMTTYFAPTCNAKPVAEAVA